jgi:hypothetical protein
MPFTQEILTSFGFKKQAALQTAQVATDMWTLPYLSAAPLQIIPTKESNAGEPGTGTPFATQTFKQALRAEKSLQARLSSEWAAMCAVFGVGSFQKAAHGTGGFKYTSTVDTGFSALESDMPVITISESVRQGANDVYDIAAIGMALEEFSISLKTGTGRDTAMLNTSWIGCGKYASPSTITHPAATVAHEVNIGGADAIAFLTIDYKTNLRLVSLDFSWKNNIAVASNYVIGGGLQNGYNLMGRMRRGKPTVSLRMRVEAVDGSTEWGDLLADTSGTGTVTILGDEITAGADHHGLSLAFQQIEFIEVKPAGGDNDLLVYDIIVDVQKHSTNGVLSMEAYCAKDSIGTAST